MAMIEKFIVDIDDFGKTRFWPKIKFDEEFLIKLSNLLLPGGKEWLVNRLNPKPQRVTHVWNHLCFLLSIILENLKILYQQTHETKVEFITMMNGLLSFLVKSKKKYVK